MISVLYTSAEACLLDVSTEVSFLSPQTPEGHGSSRETDQELRALRVRPASGTSRFNTRTHPAHLAASCPPPASVCLSYTLWHTSHLHMQHMQHTPIHTYMHTYTFRQACTHNHRRSRDFEAKGLKKTSRMEKKNKTNFLNLSFLHLRPRNHRCEIRSWKPEEGPEDRRLVGHTVVCCLDDATHITTASTLTKRLAECWSGLWKKLHEECLFTGLHKTQFVFQCHLSFLNYFCRPIVS